MSTITSLLPATLALSGDSAIEAILTDIPLFCEGIMGIGVFTFLFIVKQVKLLSVFLYGSSFLAFAAAILDLSQVLARGTENAARGVGLDTVTGFIYAREVFLSLSTGFLNLFFWKLVARCPKDECPPNVNELSTSRKQPKMHSASWNRWGPVGTLLKYGSLGALLAVPLLQMLWRLMPNERKYGSIYVAESTVQTTVTIIFILKFILNVYISPLDSWWLAFRPYVVPILALVIGTTLGVGNLVLFPFTETSLGRFLRAVEVYILILYSLYSTFQNVSQVSPPVSKPQETAVVDISKSEKSPLDSALPTSYSNGGYVPYSRDPSNMANAYGRIARDPPAPNAVSWIVSPQDSIPIQIISPDSSKEHEEDVTTFATRATTDAPRYTDVPGSNSRSRLAPSAPSGPRRQERNQVASDDAPYAGMSLSYYGAGQSSPKSENRSIMRSPSPVSRDLGYSVTEDVIESRTVVPTLAPKSPSVQPANQQGSITSIDELFRQQNELDRSIAALRLFSNQAETQVAVPSESASNSNQGVIDSSANQSRSVVADSVVTSKTESISNRSDFSLSIFPDPPVVPRNAVATKYSQEHLRTDSKSNDLETSPPQRPGPRNIEPLIIPPETAATMGSGPVSQSGLTDAFTSAGTQYDVTSFIGDLTGPSSGSGNILSPDDLGSDTDETPTIRTAVVGNAIVLRPMILASTIMSASSTEQNAPQALSASTYGPGVVSPATPDTALALRPLLLGTRSSNAPPTLPGNMVPLAQRRTRAGTLQGARRHSSVGQLEYRMMPLLEHTNDHDRHPCSWIRIEIALSLLCFGHFCEWTILATHAVADAYYVLSDPKRRQEYDNLYKSRADRSANPESSSSFFSQFAGAFGGSNSAQTGPAQPDANGVFADVFDELLRPEVERRVPWWSYLGAVSGGGIGFIVANLPGLMLGAVAGNRLGAVRDAKGKSVAAVFSDLDGQQKAEVLRALAMKVLGSAL
ncbi:hypothetical protein NLJ89_g547 [Agrocybe chaxingu]|uniref:Uncharacterized protein n=1 Tax=Agrocybe chaxingu TaxID=84603 RepID=A0A9W8N1W6_9AGAR|nr:hypothetical protein NLJ89_g547 [Agrocybe chaxingu]